MRYNKTEKEIIKAIVKHSGRVDSIAELLNKTKLIEKRGFAIVRKETGDYYLFYRWDMYNENDEQQIKGYVAELASLIERLYRERLLIPFPSSHYKPLVIGRENVKWHHFNIMSVDNDKEFIIMTNEINWIDKNRKSLYGCCWDCNEIIKPILDKLYCSYSVSEDLKDLVKNGFMSEEQIRFKKQQHLTWISIIVAVLIGLASLIIGIIGLL